MTHYTEHLAAVTDAVEEAAGSLAWREAARRLWARDHTLWQEDPAGIVDRLDWLTAPTDMAVAPLTGFVDEVRAEGIDRAVWCGMGGSSLFAEVLAGAFPAAGGIHLDLLDTTHPAAVRRVLDSADPARTLWCFASKSGTTTETRCHLDACWEYGARPDRCVVVTDAGSPLAALAVERGFRQVFHANPRIGGRFSALSHFGLLPAALLGADLDLLLASAASMAARCAPGERPSANPGLRLAAILAGAAAAGRDKCTLVAPGALGPLDPWIEQLVAESTGKVGRGILPVVGETLGPPDEYGDDRLFVAYGDDPALGTLAAAGRPVVVLGDAGPAELGGEVFRWEFATALAGVLLGVNPFDQPDVEAAKQATAGLLAERDTDRTAVPHTDPTALLASLRPGDYVAIQAFVDPLDPAVGELEEARRALRSRARAAVTLGLGPRYLHSTGQLHKGGPPTGVFLQVLDPAVTEVAATEPPIPGRPYGFARLLRAQADGDYRALRDAGRRVARVDLPSLLSSVGSETQ